MSRQPQRPLANLLRPAANQQTSCSFYLTFSTTGTGTGTLPLARVEESGRSHMLSCPMISQQRIVSPTTNIMSVALSRSSEVRLMVSWVKEWKPEWVSGIRCQQLRRTSICAAKPQSKPSFKSSEHVCRGKFLLNVVVKVIGLLCF